MIRELTIAARNFALAGNVAALKHKPRAALSVVNEFLFTERALFPNGDLPQVPIWKALGVSENVSFTLVPGYADEWCHALPSYLADLVGLCGLAQILKPEVIFEIGTLHGSGAVHLSANAPNAEVFTLDLAPSDKPKLSTTMLDDEYTRRRVYAEFGSKIHRLYGDSATFDFSPFRGKVGLFFIDGAHSYEYVRNDTMKALECIQPGGVICWHDYGRCGVNGVSRWLHGFRKGRQMYRVPGGSLAYWIWQ